MIQKAELVLSTRDMCPLQYTGADMNNVQTECLPPFNLFMTDATTILKALYLVRAQEITTVKFCGHTLRFKTHHDFEKSCLLTATV